MGVILTTTIILTLLYRIVKQAVIGIRDGKVQRVEIRRLSSLMTVQMLAVGAAMISDQSSVHEVTACISVGTLGLYFMVLSFVPKQVEQFMRILAFSFELLYALYRMSSLIWKVPVPTMMFSLNVTIAVPLLICLIYVVSLAMKISDVRFVLKSVTSWNSVCLITDVVYMVILFLYISIYFLIVVNFPDTAAWVCQICSLLMISIQSAIVTRVNAASLFVFWEDQERRIVESMKLGHSGLNNESPGVDVLYKNIYDRVIDYFETYRPYLNNDLTINDIVNVLYTNKLYISKAISMYTGRNFCQFVNYYRITYAVELFRKDTTLKIVEVANRSGFNSSVSFSMAFRLYLGEKPSDWFRQERARLSKRKK